MAGNGNGKKPTVDVRGAVSVFFVVAFVLGALGGFFAGRLQGIASAKKEYEALLNIAFPPPPVELFTIGGTVREVTETGLRIEIDDPEDYLPHADGSPRKRVERTVQVTGATEVSSVNSGAPDTAGEPLRRRIALPFLRPGDRVSVTSDMNIRTARSFTATRVEAVTY